MSKIVLREKGDHGQVLASHHHSTNRTFYNTFRDGIAAYTISPGDRAPREWNVRKDGIPSLPEPENSWLRMDKLSCRTALLSVSRKLLAMTVFKNSANPGLSAKPSGLNVPVVAICDGGSSSGSNVPAVALWRK